MGKKKNEEVVETTVKAKIYTEDAFWSAVKRKNMSDMLTMFFEAGNCPLASAVAKDTTRLTDASITRMRKALAEDLGEVPEVSNEDVDTAMEEGCDPITDAEDEANAEEVTTEDEDETRLTVGDIKAMVASGKKKKIKEAKKAFKEQFAKDHPQYKELKKLFKKDA